MKSNIKKIIQKSNFSRLIHGQLHTPMYDFSKEKMYDFSKEKYVLNAEKSTDKIKIEIEIELNDIKNENSIIRIEIKKQANTPLLFTQKIERQQTEEEKILQSTNAWTR